MADDTGGYPGEVRTDSRRVGDALNPTSGDLEGFSEIEYSCTSREGFGQGIPPVTLLETESSPSRRHRRETLFLFLRLSLIHGRGPG